MKPCDSLHRPSTSFGSSSSALGLPVPKLNAVRRLRKLAYLLPSYTLLGSSLLATFQLPADLGSVVRAAEPSDANREVTSAPSVWQSDLATAQALAAQSQRPLLLHFGSDYCPPCQVVERQVFVDPQVSRLLREQFVAVKINVDRHPEIATKYRVDSWPTDIVLSSDGRELARGTSEQQAPHFAAKLQRYAARAAERVHPMARTKWNEFSVQPVSHQAESKSTNTSSPAASHAPQLPIALDGYCPVTLTQQKAWKKASPEWGAIHRERVYLFAGEAEQQHFLANPDAFSPALAGFDIVRFVELRQRVDGKRQHGIWHRGQMFLFADEASLNQFTADATRYVERCEQLLRAPANEPHTTAPSPAADRRSPERQ